MVRCLSGYRDNGHLNAENKSLEDQTNTSVYSKKLEGGRIVLLSRGVRCRYLQPLTVTIHTQALFSQVVTVYPSPTRPSLK